LKDCYIIVTAESYIFGVNMCNSSCLNFEVLYIDWNVFFLLLYST